MKSVTRYRGKNVAGVDHALTMENVKEQKARRNLLLPLFQRANLDVFMPDLEMYSTQLITQMAKQQAAEGEVDVFRWMRLVAFDVIGKLVVIIANCQEQTTDACLYRQSRIRRGHENDPKWEIVCPSRKYGECLLCKLVKRNCRKSDSYLITDSERQRSSKTTYL